MPDYQELYHTLFNSVTDTIAELEKGDAQYAAILLRRAQRETEKIYIESEEAHCGQIDN